MIGDLAREIKTAGTMKMSNPLSSVVSSDVSYSQSEWEEEYNDDSKKRTWPSSIIYGGIDHFLEHVVNSFCISPFFVLKPLLNYLCNVATLLLRNAAFTTLEDMLIQSLDTQQDQWSSDQCRFPKYNYKIMYTNQVVSEIADLLYFQ